MNSIKVFLAFLSIICDKAFYFIGQRKVEFFSGLFLVLFVVIPSIVLRMGYSIPFTFFFMFISNMVGICSVILVAIFMTALIAALLWEIGMFFARNWKLAKEVARNRSANDKV